MCGFHTWPTSVLEQVITNSSRPFGNVVDAHQAEVVRYLCRLTDDPTEAEHLFFRRRSYHRLTDMN